MKTTIKRRAKSALAVLLTLCLVMSVFTIGISSVSAAVDDSEGVGSYNVNAKIYVEKPSGWTNVSVIVGKNGYSTAYKMSNITGTNLYYKSVSWNDATEVAFMDADWGDESFKNESISSRWAGVNNKTSLISESNWKYESGNTYRVSISGSTPSSTYYSGGYSDLNKTLTIKTAYSENGDSYSETSTKYGTFSSSGAYKLTANETSGSSSVSQTNGTGTLVTVRTNTATIIQKANSGYTFVGWKTSLNTTGSSLSSTYSFTNSGSDTTVYAYYKKTKTTLTTPTNVQINNASTYAVNAGDSSTTTLTWTGDSNASGYTIYKDNTQVGTTSGASSTSYPLTNATASAGVYTVQATTTDKTTYGDSAVSTSSATLSVYKPIYSLSGNIINYEALTIGGSTPAKTTPTYPDTWFNQYQSTYAINNTTGTAGVYSLTFKVKEDYEWTPYVCIANSSNEQKAFIYNGTKYNTATLGDLEVPDAGISSGLYLYPLASEDAGGSLQLKAGQTYTITIDQRESYDSSSPYGKITITATDAYVDTAAKKKDYNATNRAYDSVTDAASSVGTVTAVPYHGTKGGFTSTLTATVVNSNYTFTGWYDNAACTGSAVSTSATYDVANPSDSVTYYALFTQTMPNEYDVGITNPSGGTISLTSGVASTGSSASTAYAGATVGLSINITDNGKEFSSWKIISTASGADITSSVLNSGATAASASFTMPANEVTVTAVLADKTPVSITPTSNDTSLGTAGYTSGTYYVGDTINISATNVGGVFSKWQVTGASIANASSASTTIVATSSTVTIKAIFEYKTYQLFSDKDTAGNTKSANYPMIRITSGEYAGKYISTRTVTKDTGSFTVYDVALGTYARPSTTGDYEMHSGYLTNNINSWYSSSYKYKIKSSDSAAYYVIFDPSGGTVGTISISTTNPLGTIAQVYAKDGSIRYYDSGKSSGNLWEQSTGGPTANRGVTVVTKINSTAVPNPDSSKYPSTNPTLSDHLKIYSAPIGSTITIQTTVNDTYKNQGFYVGMFVVNGWKVAATKVSDGVYTANYTLSDEYDVVNLSDHGSQKSFEITPVYYNSNFEYITFYVDAASVPEKWGSTISACADYNGATNAHFEGTYPGQPLGREGDLYELKVAKYYYTYSNSTWSALTQYHPSATITAYNFDLVHHYYYVNASDDIYGASTNENYQTYDFSDFAYLAQIDKIEAILFKCKYETEKNNWQIYNKGDSAANYDPDWRNPTWYNVSTNDSLNTWQWLTDYYGNPVDAFGNRIVKSGSGDSVEYYTAEDLETLTTTSDEQVRIVSYGNRKTDSNSSARTSAKWATGWVVYTKGSTSETKYFKAYGTPADFICTTPGDTSTSNAKYYSGGSASDIEGKLTIISYDKERTNKISGVGDTGKRIDGQWYYSAQHDFDSNVKVAITTGTASTVATGNTTIEVDSNSANNTGYIGTTSGTKATLDGNTTHTYSNVTTEAALSCTLGSSYTFVGWYIYDGSTYTKIGDNFADLNTTMTMKKNYTIIAVVKVVPSGSLVITHNRYTGTNPSAHDGTGKYYVSAVVTHSDNSTTTISEAQNSIAVPGLLSTDKLTIKLRTVCDGIDTFYAWYEEALGDDYSRTGNYYEICDENVDPMGESEVSYTFFAADCSTFFSGGSLARKTLDFYSDIIHVSAYATLTYKYYDRFANNGAGNMVSYTVKNVPLTTEEIEAGYIPSDEKITQYAPAVIDTIYTDTKWTIAGTKVERQSSSVTLMATQAEKNCFVEYLLNDGVSSNLFSGNILLDVDKVAAWNTRIVPFNSWLIDENADMDNPEESNFYVSAPSSIEKGETTYNFVRFDVYSFDRLTGEIGDVIYSSNDNHFGYRIYADCVIYPVYTTESLPPVLTAKIEPAVLNREVYGDSASPVDRLYADLLISFINIANSVPGANIPEVIKNNNTDYTIETGVILDKSVNLSDTDFNTLKNAAINGSTDTTSTIIAKSDYNSQISETAVQNLAKDNTATTGLTKYMNQDDNGNPDNSKLTNKNRLDKVFRYSNTAAAQKRVFIAYSYVVIKNSSGTVVAIAISAQQRFNFAYIGNKPLATVTE